MAWGEEQDELTQEARLFLASPEVVFQELKKLSARPKADLLGRNDRLETALVKRNHPLINLGLASYGANKEVFAALYKHALEPPKNETDAKYKEGLRIGCLSNTTLTAAHLIFHFPQEIIGPQETWRVLAQGTDAETTALIRNPSIDEELLEALYQRTAMFAQMSEERWCDLVSLSSKNERLITEEEHYDSPDMGFYSIQKAIFLLLEIAPLNMRWLRVLYDLLNKLAPEQVATPEKIDHVLARWATLDDRMSDGKVSEGYHTSLSLKDEFRCLVAALYGRGFVNNASVLHGSPTAKDIALRCAYYGQGDITPKEMKAGYKRDKEAFIFAVLFNGRIYDSPKLRKPLQEEFWGGMFGRYSKYKSEREQRREQRHESLWGPEDDLANGADDAELASQHSGVQKAFGLVGYAWQIGVNLLYLAIIAFVLNRTSQLDPKLTVVIATLGLIYVTVRGLAMSQFLASAPALLGIAKSLDELKGRGGKRLATTEDYVIAEAQLKRGQIKFYIQSLFLSLTSLICLFAIYTSL
jgi:hypothetical protein